MNTSKYGQQVRACYSKSWSKPSWQHTCSEASTGLHEAPALRTSSADNLSNGWTACGRGSAGVGSAGCPAVCRGVTCKLDIDSPCAPTSLPASPVVSFSRSSRPLTDSRIARRCCINMAHACRQQPHVWVKANANKMDKEQQRRTQTHQVEVKVRSVWAGPQCLPQPEHICKAKLTLEPCRETQSTASWPAHLVRLCWGNEGPLHYALGCALLLECTYKQGANGMRRTWSADRLSQGGCATQGPKSAGHKWSLRKHWAASGTISMAFDRVATGHSSIA